MQKNLKKCINITGPCTRENTWSVSQILPFTFSIALARFQVIGFWYTVALPGDIVHHNKWLVMELQHIRPYYTHPKVKASQVTIIIMHHASFIMHHASFIIHHHHITGKVTAFPSCGDAAPLWILEASTHCYRASVHRQSAENHIGYHIVCAGCSTMTWRGKSMANRAYQNRVDKKKATWQ